MDDEKIEKLLYNASLIKKSPSMQLVQSTKEKLYKKHRINFIMILAVLSSSVMFISTNMYIIFKYIKSIWNIRAIINAYLLNSILISFCIIVICIFRKQIKNSMLK